MTARVQRPVGVMALACGAALISSCSLFHSPTPPAPESVVRPTLPPSRLAQLDFGREALFARCVPPACPIRTPKTVAAEMPSPPPASATASLIPAKLAVPDPVAPRPLPKLEASRTLTVQFASGSARLSTAARSDLDRVLTDGPVAQRVTIAGRTDDTGSPAANDQLAQARAQSVADHIRKMHPSLASALALEARGACCFIAANDTPAGRAQNRRVEVVFQASEEQRP